MADGVETGRSDIASPAVTTRRRFLKGITGAGALLWLHPELAQAVVSPAPLPDPAAAPFDHVVVLMFENRSFDHLLGWLPGADGVQAGLRFADQTGTVYPTYDLGADTQGCDYLDPDHSWEGFVTQHAGGRVDGWLQTPADRGSADTFPVGYYTADAIPALAALAENYTVLDRYFSSFMGETYPNRFYQHAARTDRDHNMGVTMSDLSPTIWDRLGDAGLTGGYYFVDEPFIGLWGTTYASLAHPVAQFLTDAAAGTLPNVSFVDPSFANEDPGQSGDYHPHGDIRAGESFLSLIYHAVRSSPAWERTVLVVNFDEWGGFYDHVDPPKVVDDTVRAALTPPGDPVPDYRQLGFRVPCIVVSPFSAAGVVHAGPYEHTSVLSMIEWRWGLDPLTARDANARNLAEVLDFGLARTDDPDIPQPTGFVSAPCGPTSTAKDPPDPVVASTSTTTTAPSTATTNPITPTSAPDAVGGDELAATGGRSTLLLGTAALTGGMAIRAANRRNREAADAASGTEAAPPSDQAVPS